MPTREAVITALRKCYDPCCKDRAISVVDMGLIEEIHIDQGNVQIEMLLTSGWCPFVANLNQMMMETVGEVEGVQTVGVEVVWNPVWTMDRLSDEARSKLTIPLEPLLTYREARIAKEKQLLQEEGG